MAPLCNVFRWQHRAVWHRAVWFDVSGITSLHFVSLGCFVSLCNPVVPVYPVWAYYAHGQQRRCQEDPVSLPPTDWRRQLGRPRIMWLSTVQQDLKQHHLTLPEAADLAQNRPLWRMTYGATQSWVACQKRRTTTTMPFLMLTQHCWSTGHNYTLCD